MQALTVMTFNIGRARDFLKIEQQHIQNTDGNYKNQTEEERLTLIQSIFDQYAQSNVDIFFSPRSC